MKFKLIFSLIFANGFLFAQNQFQKIAEDYILLRDENTNSKSFETLEGDESRVKCGFPIAAANRLNHSFTHQFINKVNPEILQRPTLPLSIISPKGYFKIHYTTSGNNTALYDINTFAAAADSAYDFEINFLHYPIPPNDNGAGGDDKIDIYILNLGNVYGFTEPEIETPAGSGKFSSYMQIDNDFAGFYTSGINAAMATIAHELHHVIQLGAYGVKYEGFELLDQYFYELHSTAMEEFVFDSVNDYYSYIKSYFNRTDKALATNTGYNLAIWNLFLKEKFGFNILKRQWELLANCRAVQAIAISIEEKSSSFNKEFNDFGIWCYFTNYRTLAGKYFEEGISYPIARPFVSNIFSSPGNNYQFSVSPTSNTFIRFINTESGRNDTLFFVLTNGDVARGIDSLSSTSLIKIGLYNKSGGGLKKLTDYYYASLSMSQPEFWLSSELINNVLIPDNGLIENKNTFAYPSPFVYSKHLNNVMTITLSNSAISGEVEFRVFSASMDLICAMAINTIFSGNNFVKWNVRKENGDKLQTGIYFYAVSKGRDVEFGKFVVIND